MAETNKNLSITLERADTRCYNLEKKVVKLKKYHKIFKNADEMSCKFCGKSVNKTLFMAHFEICNLNEDRNYDECSLYPTPSLNVTIQSHKDYEAADRAFKIEGQIGKQRCSVTRSFTEVHRLISSVKEYLKNSEILPYLEELLKTNEDCLTEENWARSKGLLQDIITTLVKIPQIRESTAFQDFLPLKTREPSSTGVISRYTESPEEKMSLPSSRVKETNILFESNSPYTTRNNHGRKESNRYYDEKNSYVNHVLMGEKGKKPITIDPDIGSKEFVFYENFDA